MSEEQSLAGHACIICDTEAGREKRGDKPDYALAAVIASTVANIAIEGLSVATARMMGNCCAYHRRLIDGTFEFLVKLPGFPLSEAELYERLGAKRTLQ